MLKKVILLAVTISAVMLFPGCETMKDIMKPPKVKENIYVLSLHQIIKYPRAKNLEREISTIDGRHFWINTNQFFHSRHIEEVKLIPRKDKKDFYDIAMKLDHNGIVKWVQLSMQFRSEKMALLIDGHFYKFYIPEPLANEEDDWVLLNGPFDKITAKGIEKYAHRNYIYFNPNKQGLAEFFDFLQEAK